MRKLTHFSLWGVLAWAGLVVAGSVAAERYSATAGVTAQAPIRWPLTSHLQQDAVRPTLLMFVHPHCPCSRASLHELESLIARSKDRAKVYIVFALPSGAPAGWSQTALHQAAESVADAAVVDDTDETEAARFGVATSGDVLLYSRSGKLMFHGGITGARGHEGENLGVDAVVALIHGAPAPVAATAVFGCPLCGPQVSINGVVACPR